MSDTIKSTSSVQCSSCNSRMRTPATYPDGSCPICGSTWAVGARQDASVTVSMPQAASGGTG